MSSHYSVPHSLDGPVRDDDGASAVEYGLLGSLIAAVVVLAVLALGVTTSGLLHRPCTAVRDAGAPSTCQAPAVPAATP